MCWYLATQKCKDMMLQYPRKHWNSWRNTRWISDLYLVVAFACDLVRKLIFILEAYKNWIKTFPENYVKILLGFVVSLEGLLCLNILLQKLEMLNLLKPIEYESILRLDWIVLG